MSTYSTPFDVSSFFVPRECLLDDPWEYVDESQFASCKVQRAVVSAVVGTFIVLLFGLFPFAIAVIAKSVAGIAATVIIGVIVLLFIWLAVLFTGAAARRQYAKMQVELSSLRRYYRGKSDDEIREIFRREQRDDRNLMMMQQMLQRQQTSATPYIVGAIGGAALSSAFPR